MEGIDRNRGVTIRTDPNTGAQVFMYKAEPGVFLSAFGTVVSDRLARTAGFDVKTLTRERDKRTAMAKSLEKIEAEFDDGNKAGQRKVVTDIKGFKLLKLPYGRYSVEDPEGNVLNTKHMTKEEATTFLNDMVSALVKDEPEEAKEDK